MFFVTKNNHLVMKLRFHRKRSKILETNIFSDEVKMMSLKIHILQQNLYLVAKRSKILELI